MKPDYVPKRESIATDFDDGTIPSQYINTVVDAYDNDGEVSDLKEEDKAGMFLTGIGIAKNCLGTGFLNYPVIIRTWGIIPGTITILIVASFAYFSSDFLLQCKDITRRYGYAMYGKMSMGKNGTLVLKIVLIISNFGTVCFYYKILGELILSILSVFTDFSSESMLSSASFYTIVCFFLLFPLIYLRGIHLLAKTSFLGVLSIIIFFICIIILFIFKSTQPDVSIQPHFEPRMLWPCGNWIEMFVCFSAMIDSYIYKFNFFPLYLSLKPRNNSTMRKSVILGIMLCCSVSCAVGILCFLMYGYSYDHIIEVFHKEIVNYRGVNTFILSLFVLVVVCYSLSSMLTIPLVFFSVKTNAVNLVIMLKMEFFRKKRKESGNEGVELIDKDKEEGNNNNNNTEVNKTKTSNDNDDMNVITPFMNWIIVTLTYVAVLVCTLYVDKVISISNFLGSTASNMVMLVYPALFLIKLDVSNRKNILPKISVLIGSVTFMLFIVSEIQKVIDPSMT